MFLQPAPPPETPWWDVGNYRWSESFIWIFALFGLIFGMILFASYINNRKKQILMWALSLLGIWVFYHNLIAGGTYLGLLVVDGGVPSSTFGVILTILPLLIPGFIAAGLLFTKSEKAGMFYSWGIVVLSVAFYLVRCDNYSKILTDWELIADILIVTVQLVSTLLIIVLPIMDEGHLGPRSMMSVAGILMFTTDFLWAIPMFFDIHSATIDTICMIMPFLMIITGVCLVYGIIGKKSWGFTLSHVEFDEE